jgi:hypothetical protein
MNNQEESVKIQFDFYQNPTSVIVSIFAKRVDQEKSLIKFNASTVSIPRPIHIQNPLNRELQLC